MVSIEEIKAVIEEHNAAIKKNNYEDIDQFYKNNPEAKFQVKIDSERITEELTAQYNYLPSICRWNNSYMMADLEVAHSKKAINKEIERVFEENSLLSLLKNQVGISAAKFGTSFVLCYTTDDEEPRFKLCEVQPDKAFVKYHDATGEPLFGIRRWSETVTNDKGKTETVDHVEVYEKDTITSYVSNGKEWEQVQEVPNIFGIVPLIEFRNNFERVGEAQQIIKANRQINALCAIYLEKFSRTANEILHMSNIDLSPEAWEVLKSSGIAIDRDSHMGDKQLQSKIEYVQNQIPGEFINFIEKQIEWMYATTGTPQLDKLSAGSVDISGSAIKMRLTQADEKAYTRQEIFKQALRKVLTALCKYLNTRDNSALDAYDFSIKFTKVNYNSEDSMSETEKAQLLKLKLENAQALKDLECVSIETIMKTAGIEDPEKELKKYQIEQEQQLTGMTYGG